MWDTRFGGHLQAGETTEKALLAELEEEIGIKANLKDFIKGLTNKRDSYPNNEFTYTFYYPGEEDISNLKFQDNEVQEVKWMSAKEIIREANNNSSGWSAGLLEFESVYNFLISLKLKKNIKII
jgi:8-oxo-dGTP pyrophosphatase MutT (NUDIX family)